MNTLFSSAQQNKAQALGNLVFTNPFGEERISLEKQILGKDYINQFHVWVITPSQQGVSPNLEKLAQAAEDLLASAQHRLQQSYQATEAEWQIYGELALYAFYYRYENAFFQVITTEQVSKVVMPFYKRFVADWQSIFANTPLVKLAQYQCEHMFALFFQTRRAFHYIFRAILGTSHAATALRISVWQSIFGYDLRRYHRSLYGRMHEISTLILGESGTGKELVASAIGLARYIPFNGTSQRFEGDYAQHFQAVHLAALPLTLLESELFGHKKGAFTGASHDRAGYLETTQHSQSVFLDEIGELPAEVQVKLLRVLQNRRFQRVGDTQSLEFYGKIISATHRDLGAAIEQGHFRADLYYRLCSDIIRTPSLATQLADNPDELHHLINLVTAKIVNAEIAHDVANEAYNWIRQHLPNYTWAGNMRELEQCVRSILIHGAYYPAYSQKTPHAKQQFANEIMAGNLDHDAMIGRYYALVYAQTQSYEAAAQRLNTNWRTVKSRMDMAFLERLKGR